MFELSYKAAEAAFLLSDNAERATAVIEILQNIAYFSQTQAQLTNNLTLLRKAAREQGQISLFMRCYETAKNGSIDPNDMGGLEWQIHYSLDDYTDSEEPYKEVFYQPTPFLKERALERLAIEAGKLGCKTFKKLYKAYESGMRKGNVSSVTAVNPTDFPNQPLELECGLWHCDSSGVSKVLKDRNEYACLHPIMPIERLVNIDTGEEKLRISFFKGRYWRDFIASKRDLFDSSKIIQFSALGVSVTSKSAKLLSEFLCDVETLNPDIIPETESVGRLGYIGNGELFSPYVDNIVFDGDASYSTLYAAITEHGDYTKWLVEAQKCRSESLTAQVMLAASFASPLIGKIGCLSFFVHLWGVESGTGKTVALMLAASVWGNPDIGQYIQTFNATQVGHEKTAAFLNNVPMCIDELQLSKDSHGHSKFDVYQLSQGTGRTRGNKSGGVDKTPRWALCVLTTGESPLTSDSSGAGAVNRVIDIECKAADSVIKDGFATSSCLKQNYGFAGRKYIEALTPEVFEKVTERYRELLKKLLENNTTEKQAMAAALVIIGDELADEFIFHSGKVLTVEQMSQFLKDKSDVSAGQRAYNFLCDWVAVNANRFNTSDNVGEFWGKIDDENNKVYIISSIFRKALTDNGFDERAVLSWLRSNNKIIPYKDGKSSKPISIDGHKARFIEMYLQDENGSFADESEYIEIL